MIWGSFFIILQGFWKIYWRYTGDILGCLRLIRVATPYQTGIYLSKVNNGNTRTRCEICSNLTVKIPERRQLRLFGVLTFNIFHTFFSVSIVNFEHVIAGWAMSDAFIIHTATYPAGFWYRYIGMSAQTLAQKKIKNCYSIVHNFFFKRLIVLFLTSRQTVCCWKLLKLLFFSVVNRKGNRNQLYADCKILRLIFTCMLIVTYRREHLNLIGYE